MSSCEFHPVWPANQSRELGELALPQMDGSGTAKPTDGAELLLEELGFRADECSPREDTGGGAGSNVVEQAYKRGFSEGREQGVAEGYERVLPALEALSGLTQALEQTRADFCFDLERGLHALAIAVAKHLIQREVTADPTIVSDLVQQALELVPHDVTLEVRLNPEDLEALQGRLDQVEASGRPLHIQWMGDATLERGSFLLETPLRVVDGRTDEALRALYDRLA
jgi:flagellar biosynthesis/type III secretory pathway protein FliH